VKAWKRHTGKEVISIEIGQKNDKKEQIQQEGAVMAVRVGKPGKRQIQP